MTEIFGGRVKDLRVFLKEERFPEVRQAAFEFILLHNNGRLCHLGLAAS